MAGEKKKKKGLYLPRQASHWQLQTVINYRPIAARSNKLINNWRGVEGHDMLNGQKNLKRPVFCLSVKRHHGQLVSLGLSKTVKDGKKGKRIRALSIHLNARQMSRLREKRRGRKSSQVSQDFYKTKDKKR